MTLYSAMNLWELGNNLNAMRDVRVHLCGLGVLTCNQPLMLGGVGNSFRVGDLLSGVWVLRTFAPSLCCGLQVEV